MVASVIGPIIAALSVILGILGFVVYRFAFMPKKIRVHILIGRSGIESYLVKRKDIKEKKLQLGGFMLNWDSDAITPNPSAFDWWFENAGTKIEYCDKCMDPLKFEKSGKDPEAIENEYEALLMLNTILMRKKDDEVKMLLYFAIGAAVLALIAGCVASYFGIVNNELLQRIYELLAPQTPNGGGVVV